MYQKQLEWLITVASNGPATNLEQVRHKAACLLKLAEMLEDAVKPADPDPADSV